MSDVASDGVHLTKEYYRDFLPTDLQWEVTEVDKDFTLYDLFRLVYHANMMIPGISNTMGVTGFEEFWDQIQLDRDQDDQDDIQYLELYWSTYYDVTSTKKTGKSTDQSKSQLFDDGNNHFDNPNSCEVSSLMGFHGIGSGCHLRTFEDHECGDDCDDITAWGIGLSPVNNLAHLPIRISPAMMFCPPYVESDRDLRKTNFKLKMIPTLWCLITSVFWELTFYGSTPDNVTRERDGLESQISEIRDHFEQTRRDNDEITETDDTEEIS